MDWDWCTSFIRTFDGNYIIGGYTKGHTWYSDFWLLKVSENGDSLWSCTFGGDAAERCMCVRQAADGGFVMAGTTESFGRGLTDFWLVKTESELLAKRHENPLPDEYALHQNWPNPFNPKTTIKFDVKKGGQVQLKVYNLLGQEIATLVDENLSPGIFSIVWDAGDLPSGVYICRLEMGSFISQRKMVLLK